MPRLKTAQAVAPAPTTRAGAVERTARRELACALRAAAHYGLSEGICNHFSLALPAPAGAAARVLINPQGMHWSEIGPDDLVLLSAAGQPVNPAQQVEPTAFYIHSAIHRVSADAACVLHTHMPFANALTLLDGGRLVMAHQNALRFHGQVAYDDYRGLVLDAREGERIARRLRQASVLFLAHHGVIVRGPSVAWAFDDLYYLERACMHQVLAQGTGQPLQPIAEHIAERTARQMQGERQQSDLHLAALLRMLGPR